jgi:hypothetical protein
VQGASRDTGWGAHEVAVLACHRLARNESTTARGTKPRSALKCSAQGSATLAPAPSLVPGGDGAPAAGNRAARQPDGRVLQDAIARCSTALSRNRGVSGDCFGEGSAQLLYRNPLGGFRFESNDLFNQQPGEAVIQDEFDTGDTGAAYEASYPDLFTGNVELAPDFRDATNHDFVPGSSSPLIDAGVSDSYDCWWQRHHACRRGRALLLRWIRHRWGAG